MAMAQLDVLASQLDAQGEIVLNLLNAPVAPVRLTRAWPLASASSAAFIAGGYLLFVFFGRLILPYIMGKKEPYALKFVYNLVQVGLCSYMTIEAGLLAYRNGYSPVCNVAKFQDPTPPMANLLWLFYLSKVLDFADTFFIIVGQKWAQLSFLHVYHHSTIFLVYWANLGINYDGDVYLTIFLNGAIHAVMYTYYFVSMHTKDIWWKKYLTMMQLIQFTMMMSQAGALLFVCEQNPSGDMTKLYFVYIGSLFALFMHFYIKSYTKKPAVSSKKKGA